MPDYGRYCPVALGTEVIADRWTPLILRELILGNTRFNDIARGLPGISRSLLTQRLRHLERKGVVELWPSPTGKGNEYHLTPAGKDLESVVMALGRWAVEWLYDDIEPQAVEPTVLLWWMHRRMDDAELPSARNQYTVLNASTRVFPVVASATRWRSISDWTAARVSLQN